MHQRQAPSVMKMQRPPNMLSRLLSALFWGFGLLVLWAAYLWWVRGFAAAFNTLSHQENEVQMSALHLISLQPWYSLFSSHLFIASWQAIQKSIAALCATPLPSKWTTLLRKSAVGQDVSRSLYEAAVLLLCIIKTLGLKCLMLFAALPLFLLSLVVGLSDGLMQRAIRTASLGRESAYLFHQLSQYALQVIFAGVLLFLVLPLTHFISVSLLILAALVGLGTAQVAGRFKKYL